MKWLPMAMIIALAIVGCRITDPISPTPNVKDTDLCGEAEVRIIELQCKDRRGDPMWINRNGEKFEDTCRIAQKEGGIFLNPKCVRGAKTCAEMRNCPAMN